MQLIGKDELKHISDDQQEQQKTRKRLIYEKLNGTKKSKIKFRSNNKAFGEDQEYVVKIQHARQLVNVQW